MELELGRHVLMLQLIHTCISDSLLWRICHSWAFLVLQYKYWADLKVANWEALPRYWIDYGADISTPLLGNSYFIDSNGWFHLILISLVRNDVSPPCTGVHCTRHVCALTRKIFGGYASGVSSMFPVLDQLRHLGSVWWCCLFMVYD